MANKKGAVELSVSTIVIIVLAMSMLILGMVLVRSIMCGAIGMTTNINTKVEGEINNLFEATGAEVACIGAGEDPVALIPGRTNTIYCKIRADKTAEYNIKVKSISAGDLKEAEIRKWIIGDDFYKRTVSPNDEEAKKFLRLDVPDNAPVDLVTIRVEVYKSVDNSGPTLISSPDLDFQIKRVGIIRAAVC